jgi:hypothetical protein
MGGSISGIMLLMLDGSGEASCAPASTPRPARAPPINPTARMAPLRSSKSAGDLLSGIFMPICQFEVESFDVLLW